MQMLDQFDKIDNVKVETPPKLIVFFDGICGLCSEFVDFCLPRDPDQRLRFSALQGETALRRLSPADRNDLSSIVVIDRGRVLYESDAVIAVLYELKQPWPLVAHLFRAVPRWLRNFFYRIVARARYRVFGRRETCRLPTFEERKSFLP